MYTLPNFFILFDTEYTAWKGSLDKNWSGSSEYKEILQIIGFKLEKKFDILCLLFSYINNKYMNRHRDIARGFRGSRWKKPLLKITQETE